MSCSEVIVGIHGLYDEDADLIIEGSCGDCGAQLWRRRYDRENSIKLTVAMLKRQTAMDAEADQLTIERHCCRPDC